MKSEVLNQISDILVVGGFIMSDIDGTIKGPKNKVAPKGFNPRLPFLLEGLSSHGVLIGVATARADGEVEQLYEEMGYCTFKGPRVLEDGQVIIRTTGEKIILGSLGTQQEIRRLRYELQRQWAIARNPLLSNEGWGYFPTIETPVQIPEGIYQGEVTLAIWEKGPDNHSPNYDNQYEMVRGYVDTLLVRGSMRYVDLHEAGNGTLRVIERGFSKATGLRGLQARRDIDLSRTLYIGDGLNDVEAAVLVREQKGVVIAVANAHPDLKQIANIVTEAPASHGIVEVLEKVVRL